MLISPDHRFIVSSLGWVDKSSLWIYDTAKDKTSLVSLGNAKHFSLHTTKDANQFTVFHHSYDSRIRITLHAFANPGVPLCTIEHSGGNTRVEGDANLLPNAPRYYVTYYNPENNADFHLISIDRDRAVIQAERFDWYDDSYDKGYQGIVGVIELPSGEMIVSVQRDSHPVIYDPKTKRVLRKLSLADRGGNPRFRFAQRRGEIWADDYDTILKLDSSTFAIKGSQRMQMAAKGTAQFIGDWLFNDAESLCFISRPFSGDIVVISTEDLKTKYVARTGKQPLEVAFLNNGVVIGRDWKTGELLKGSLQRKWFG